MIGRAIFFSTLRNRFTRVQIGGPHHAERGAEGRAEDARLAFLEGGGAGRASFQLMPGQGFQSLWGIGSEPESRVKCVVLCRYLRLINAKIQS